MKRLTSDEIQMLALEYAKLKCSPTDTAVNFAKLYQETYAEILAYVQGNA